MNNTATDITANGSTSNDDNTNYKTTNHNTTNDNTTNDSNINASSNKTCIDINYTNINKDLDYPTIIGAAWDVVEQTNCLNVPDFFIQLENEYTRSIKYGISRNDTNDNIKPVSLMRSLSSATTAKQTNRVKANTTLTKTINISTTKTTTPKSSKIKVTKTNKK